MNIQILQLVEGAKNARGLTVVIDVFRAFSLECYLHDMGVKQSGRSVRLKMRSV